MWLKYCTVLYCTVPSFGHTPVLVKLRLEGVLQVAAISRWDGIGISMSRPQRKLRNYFIPRAYNHETILVPNDEREVNIRLEGFTNLSLDYQIKSKHERLRRECEQPTVVELCVG